MSIEQTNQLILLILNSVLMMLLSAALLCGAWLRQSTLLQKVHRVKSRYQQLTRSSGRLATTSDITQATGVRAGIKVDPKRVKEYHLRLNRQYQWSRIGMLVLHGALIAFGVSLLCLSLRSLFNVDRLVIISLVLFTFGSAGFIAGSSCILIDLSKGNSQSDSLARLLSHSIEKIGFRYQTLNQKKEKLPHS